MTFIIILRHGPTIRGEKLDKEKFSIIINELCDTINDICHVKYIYTSEFSRTIDTAKMIMHQLDVDECIKKERYNRLDKRTECECKYMKRIRSIGKKLKNSNKNTLVITHSSIILDILREISNFHIKKFKIHTAALFVYDTEKEEFILFNESFY
jgi:broad specificity phosphatase PhoE